jgi:predicted RNA-binding Zn-ribbon protein involved in translation (DUF1610 family)/DNA repair exonuclease SbcCD ATPase subunit
MARKIVTPERTTHCSTCGTAVEDDPAVCVACGEVLSERVEGFLCDACGKPLEADATRCDGCRRQFGIPAGGEDVLKSILEWRRKGANSRFWLPPKGEILSADVDGTTPKGDAIYELSEPFQRMLRDRRRRLQHMDQLIDQARRRIRTLEGSRVPAEIRERETLKRNVEEILLEKEEIRKIEVGIVEMERIYRNILTLQQSELRQREDALRTRVDAFKRELEERARRTAEMEAREAEMVRREKALRETLNALAKKERALAKRQATLDRKMKEARAAKRKYERAKARLEEAEERRSLVAVEVGDGTLTVKEDERMRALTARVEELEMQVETTLQEKAQLEKERKERRAFERDLKRLLRVLDDLLEQLPDEAVKAFAASKTFALYEKVLDRLGV